MTPPAVRPGLLRPDLLRPAACLLLLACLVGCGSNPAAARKALPKSFPAVRNNWHGTVDRVEFNENFSLDDYDALVFLPLDTSETPMPPKDNTYEPVRQALARSTTVIAQGIETRVKTVPVRVASAGEQPGGKVLLLRGAVVEMNPGSQAARAWVGMGAGSAGTRVSGELVDGPTGRTLVRFKDGKVASGGMFGGGYDDLLNQNMKGLGEDIGLLVSAFSPRAASKKK